MIHLLKELDLLSDHGLRENISSSHPNGQDEENIIFKKVLINPLNTNLNDLPKEK